MITIYPLKNTYALRWGWNVELSLFERVYIMYICHA